MLSYPGGSPAYSSCSSEDLETLSNDRQCMRCLIHKLENGTDGDAFPTASKFTRSFSVESNRSFQELFKSSEEDFSAEGTRVLFCKALDVTSDEEEDRKGIKRTYEDRQERKKFARYKRQCSPDGYNEKHCPSSTSTLRSYRSRRTPKRLPERPSSGCKQKSKPASNRNLLGTSPQRDLGRNASKRGAKPSREHLVHKSQLVTSKVPSMNCVYMRGEEDAVTVYEKTIITVTSSDNYLLGDPLSSMDRYNSDISPIGFQTMAKAVSKQMRHDAYMPPSIGVYGANAFRKGMLNNRDASLTRSNDMQILPVIQELNNIGEDGQSSMIIERTKSTVLTDSEFRNQGRRPQRSITMRPNHVKMVESKSHVQRFQSISQGSTLFPNSCLKKETIRTNSSKKSVRFMVSESQISMGGESVPKRSLRLEKFPSGLSVKSTKGNDGKGNLTAAPVVLRIENATMECMQGTLEGEGMEKIIRRETAQTVFQEQLINNIIRNITTSRGGHSMQLLKCPTALSAPGMPFGFVIEGANKNVKFSKSKDNEGSTFKAVSQKRPGTGDITEIHYTLSDLGIPRNKKNDKEPQNIRQKANSEVVPSGVRPKRPEKTNSLEERRKHIRLKLHEPHPKDNETSSDTREVSEINTVVPDRVVRRNTVVSNVPKPRSGRARVIKTPTNNKERIVLQTENLGVDSNKAGEYDANKKLGDILPHLQRSKNQGTAMSKFTNRGKTRKETVTTRRVNEVQFKKDHKIEIMNGESTSTKSHNMSATDSSKLIGSRDLSPISVMSTKSGAARPRSNEIRKSSSGGSRSRDICELNERERAIDPRSTLNEICSRTESPSPNRPPSRKPHLNQVGRVVNVNLRSPDKSPGAPRTHLTLRLKAQPDPKTTSTIREHLRSSGMKPAAPGNKSEEPKRTEVNPTKQISKKLTGHPLKNKTLSEFLEERKSSMGHSKKKNVDENRRISEPVKRYR